MRPRRSAEPVEFIWATRGRTWGFRFLRSGGLDDPLEVYEGAFSTIADKPEGCRRLDRAVALRFLDPEGRQDAAGRVIPHDFVLFGAWAEGIDSLEAGIQRIWPVVGDEFMNVWDVPDGPQPQG